MACATTPVSPVRSNRTRLIRWIAATLCIVAVVLVALQYEWSELIDQLEQMPPVLAVGLMMILPVVGFPISIVYVAIGARFGPAVGCAVVAVVTTVHLLAIHGIGRTFLRKPLQRAVERRGHHLPQIPPGEEASIAAIIALAPGPPYFVRNYLLAISDIPLRIYFGIALTVYTIRSTVALFLGNLGDAPSWKGIAILAAVYALKLGICGALLWHLRGRHRRLNRKSA